MAVDPAQVAVIVVHGNGEHYRGPFARRYPWPRLQLEQLRRHTPAGYKVLVFGNDLIPNHEEILRGYAEVELHLSTQPLHRALGRRVWPARNFLARQAHKRFRHIVVLDSDAFPVAPDWLERYVGRLDESKPLVAVQRVENGDDFSHPSFMLFSSQAWRQHLFDFSPLGARDAGATLSRDLEAEGLDWHRLLRTNRWNPHPLTAGVYDERIYHHGAGTRQPKFRATREARADAEGLRRELELHRGLFDLLFEDPQGLVDRLLGRAQPLPEEEVRRRGARTDED